VYVVVVVAADNILVRNLYIMLLKDLESVENDLNYVMVMMVVVVVFFHMDQNKDLHQMDMIHRVFYEYNLD
jgi:hypothetical protein